MWKEYSTKPGGIGFLEPIHYLGDQFEQAILFELWSCVLDSRVSFPFVMISYKETTPAAYLDFLDCTLTEPLYCN